jgi:hypothetical protein
MFTETSCGEFVAPTAVTVMMPLGPAVALTWNVPPPFPDVGETVIFG